MCVCALALRPVSPSACKQNIKEDELYSTTSFTDYVVGVIKNIREPNRNNIYRGPDNLAYAEHTDGDGRWLDAMYVEDLSTLKFVKFEADRGKTLNSAIRRALRATRAVSMRDDNAELTCEQFLCMDHWCSVSDSGHVVKFDVCGLPSWKDVQWAKYGAVGTVHNMCPHKDCKRRRDDRNKKKRAREGRVDRKGLSEELVRQVLDVVETHFFYVFRISIYLTVLKSIVLVPPPLPGMTCIVRVTAVRIPPLTSCPQWSCQRWSRPQWSRLHSSSHHQCSTSLCCSPLLWSPCCCSPSLRSSR